MDQPVIDVVHLFPGLRAALIDLLDGLAPTDWSRPTACGDWTVHDVALHLLGVDANILGPDRDGYREPVPAGLDLSNWSNLVAFIDRRNAIWVEATRRLSPRLTRHLLAETGPQVEAWFRSVDLLARGNPVNWVGPAPAPVWMHVAREYTERWMHQQHIRDAVGRPGLMEPEWLHPVLAAFALALPHTLRDVTAQLGVTATLEVTGPAGGTWSIVREVDGWWPTADRPSDPIAALRLDQDTAWRLFTRGISQEEARLTTIVSGDPAITDAMLGMVSIIA